MGLGLTLEPKMLEMRVGFTLGHLTPAAFAEEPLHEGVDVRSPDVLRNRADFLEAIVMMFLDRVRAPLQILEGVAMGGQRKIHVTDLADSVE